MARGIAPEQVSLCQIITDRDSKRLLTTTEDLTRATGRAKKDVWQSLERMKRRGMVRRAGKLGKSVVWTASERLALSYQRPVLTCVQGDNSDLLVQVARVYVPQGSTVADVTYGLRVFWRKIDETQYRLLKSDIAPRLPDVTAADFRFLPYEKEQIDVVILDPPYMHGGLTVKPSINSCYLNENGTSKSILELYREGIKDAHRVLKTGGLIMVKVGDEIESGKVQFAHINLHHQLEKMGFEVVQHFVLMRKSIPAMREAYQLHARTNHSYLLLGKKRRARLLPDSPDVYATQSPQSVAE